MDNEEKRSQFQYEGLIQGLINKQYGYSNNFISKDTVAGLRDNIQNFSEMGHLQPAGMGNTADSSKNPFIRGDKIKWIEKESTDQFEAIYIKKVGDFIEHLNKTCFTSINSFESHYASYEQRSFYKKHVDQFKNEKGRKFSIVLFLNQDWQKADGGMLSLYPEGGKQKNILPIGGRMVFFRSDEMEHEVQPSFTRDRRSIAGWFKS